MRTETREVTVFEEGDIVFFFADNKNYARVWYRGENRWVCTPNLDSTSLHIKDEMMDELLKKSEKYFYIENAYSRVANIIERKNRLERNKQGCFS